jgi:hypothetical protein
MRQCAVRWKICVNPILRKGLWTNEEDKVILSGVAHYGHRWALIAKHLNGRSDCAVKNRYCGYLSSLVLTGVHNLQEIRKVSFSKTVSEFNVSFLFLRQLAIQSGIVDSFEDSGSAVSEGGRGDCRGPSDLDNLPELDDEGFTQRFPSLEPSNISFGSSPLSIWSQPTLSDASLHQKAPLSLPSISEFLPTLSDETITLPSFASLISGLPWYRKV